MENKHILLAIVVIMAVGILAPYPGTAFVAFLVSTYLLDKLN